MKQQKQKTLSDEEQKNMMTFNYCIIPFVAITILCLIFYAIIGHTSLYFSNVITSSSFVSKCPSYPSNLKQNILKISIIELVCAFLSYFSLSLLVFYLITIVLQITSKINKKQLFNILSWAFLLSSFLLYLTLLGKLIHFFILLKLSASCLDYKVTYSEELQNLIIIIAIGFISLIIVLIISLFKLFFEDGQEQTSNSSVNIDNPESFEHFADIQNEEIEDALEESKVNFMKNEKKAIYNNQISLSFQPTKRKLLSKKLVCSVLISSPQIVEKSQKDEIKKKNCGIFVDFPISPRRTHSVGVITKKNYLQLNKFTSEYSILIKPQAAKAQYCEKRAEEIKNQKKCSDKEKKVKEKYQEEEMINLMRLRRSKLKSSSIKKLQNIPGAMGNILQFITEVQNIQDK